MHRYPFGDDSGERVMPGQLAREARDRWIASQGGEEAIKRRIAVGGGPSTGDLDYYVSRWHLMMTTKGTERLRRTINEERLRRIRRARRRYLLLVIVCAMATGASVASVIFYGFLYRH